MEADPSTVLEWLLMKTDDTREMQLTALEQLCTDVLFSDNIDAFFVRYNPRVFLPVLCQIFTDELAPDKVLEADARSITYFLELAADCVRPAVGVSGFLKAVCVRLDAIDMSSDKSNELGQQIIKMLHLIVSRSAMAVYEAGGLNCVLRFIKLHSQLLHADVLHAGMDLVQQLCNCADPLSCNLSGSLQSLTQLLNHDDAKIADQALRCFANIVERFTRKGLDPSPVATPYLIDRLLQKLRVAGGAGSTVMRSSHGLSCIDTTEASASSTSLVGTATAKKPAECNPAVVGTVTNVLITLCCSSPTLTRRLLSEESQLASTLAEVLQRGEDSVILSVGKLIELLLLMLSETPHPSVETQRLNRTLSLASEPQTPSVFAFCPQRSHAFGAERNTVSSTAASNCSITEVPEQDAEEKSSSRVEVPSATSTPSALKEVEKIDPSALTSSAVDSTDAPIRDTQAFFGKTNKHIDDAKNENSRADWERDSCYRSLIEAIKRHDMEQFNNIIAAGTVDFNYTDNLGQTLLNWAASFGTSAMVNLLCVHGADPNVGVRGSLSYAADFGGVEICDTLLFWGANPEQRDKDGARPLDRARLRPLDKNSQRIIQLLKSKEKRRQSTLLTGDLLAPNSGEDSPASHLTNAPSLDSGATQDAFISHLLPVLVGVFNTSLSQCVKRQVLALVQQMTASTKVMELQKLSKMQVEGLPFSFHLSQMIYTVLAEETDTSALCSLQMAQNLLTKLPAVYVAIFYRIGLVALIRAVSMVLGHAIFTNHRGLNSDTACDDDDNCCGDDDYEEAEGDSECSGEAEQEREEDDEEEDDDEDDEEQPPDAQDADEQAANAEEHVDTTQPDSQGAEHQEGVDGSPEDPSTAEGQEPEQEGTEAERAPTPQPEPLVLRCGEVYCESNWRVAWFGHLLFVFNEYAIVEIEVSCPQDQLCAMAMLGDMSTPLELRAGQEAVERPEIKKEQLRLSSRIHTLFGNACSSVLFPNYQALDCSGNNEQRTRRRLRRPVNRAHSLNWLNHRHLHGLLQNRSAAGSHDQWRSSRGKWRHFNLPVNSGKPPPVPSQPKQIFLRQTSSPASACLLPRRRRRGGGDKKQPSEHQLPPAVCKDEAVAGSLRLSIVRSSTGEDYICIKPVVSSRKSSASSKPDIADAPATADGTATAPPAPEALFFSLSDSNGFFRAHLSSMPNTASASTAHIPSATTTGTSADEDELRYRRKLRLFRAIAEGNFERREESDGDSSSTGTSTADSEAASQLMPQGLAVGDDFWVPTYRSGSLSQTLNINAEDGNPPSSVITDSQLGTKFRLHRLARRLLCRELSFAGGMGRNSAPATPHSAPDDALPTSLQIRTRLQDLSGIADDLLAAAKCPDLASGTCASPLDRLADAFCRVASLFTSGPEAITAYELSVSGIVPALLFCLSPSEAVQWDSCELVEGACDFPAQLRFLRQRRLLFSQAFLPVHNGSGISCLIQRLVQAFEQTEHLPLYLFETCPFLPDRPPRRTQPKLAAAEDELPQSAEGVDVASPPIVVDSPAIASRRRISTRSSYSGSVLSALPLPRMIAINPPTQEELAPYLSLPLGLIALYSQTNAETSATVVDQRLNRALALYFPAMVQPGCANNLHQLSKRGFFGLRLLNRDTSEDCVSSQIELLDLSGRHINLRPLTNVGQLEQCISRIVTKQWHERERTNLIFYSLIKSNTAGGIRLFPPSANSSPLTSSAATRLAKRQSSVTTSPATMEMGVIDWLATNAGTRPINEWVNPAGAMGVVSIYASNAGLGGSILGLSSAILSPAVGSVLSPGSTRHCGCVVGINSRLRRLNLSNHALGVWLAVDLGLQLVPSAYAMAYLTDTFTCMEQPMAPRNWCLQASNDARNWVTLSEHVDDASLMPVPGSNCRWSLSPSMLQPWPKCNAPAAENSPELNGEDAYAKGWRCYRIMQTGANCKGLTELCVGGLEFYGTVLSVHEKLFSPSALSRGARYARSLHSRRHAERTESSQKDGSAVLSPTPPISVPGAEGTPPVDADEISVARKRPPLSTFRDQRQHITALQHALARALTARHALAETGTTSTEAATPDATTRSLNSPAEPTDEAPNNIDSPSDQVSSDQGLTEFPVASDSHINAITRVRPITTSRAVAVTDSHSSVSLLAPCDAPEATIEAPLAELQDDAAEFEFAEAVDAIIQLNAESALSFVGRNSRALFAEIAVHHLAQHHGDDDEDEDEAMSDAFGNLIEDEEFEEDGVDVDDDRENEGATGTRETEQLRQQARPTEDSQVTDHTSAATRQAESASVPSQLPSAEIFEDCRDPETDQVSSVPPDSNYGLPLSSANDAVSLPVVDSQSALSAVATGTGEETTQPKDSEVPAPEEDETTAPQDSRQTSEESQLPTKPESRSTAGRSLAMDGDFEQYRLPPGLIPAFDPHPGRANAPATTEYQLQHPPNTPTSQKHRAKDLNDFVANQKQISFCILLPLPDNQQRTVTVNLERANVSVFYYVLKLLDEVAYHQETSLLIAEGVHPVLQKVEKDDTGETDPSEAASNQRESAVRRYASKGAVLGYLPKVATPDAIETHDTGELKAMLTDRDLRLHNAILTKFTTFVEYIANVRSEERDNQPLSTALPPIHPAALPVTPLSRTADAEQLLRLTRLLYQLSGMSSASEFPEAVDFRGMLTADAAGDNSDMHTATSFSATPVMKPPCFSLAEDPSGDQVLSNKEVLRSEDFISKALTRKLLRQIHDPLAIATGFLPDWCLNLPRRLSALFPFDVRLKLFRSSAFGTARSVIWLQANIPTYRQSQSAAVGDQSCGAQQGSPTSLNARLRHTETTHLAATLASLLARGTSETAGGSHTSGVLSGWLSSYGALSALISGGLTSARLIDLAASSIEGGGTGNYERSSSYSSSRGGRVVELARLHKEYIRVPRLSASTNLDQSMTAFAADQEGCGGSFWDWAEQLMLEHADRKSELEIQFIGEQGIGLGPTLEFFSLLAADLRRRDAHMWVEDNAVMAEPSQATATVAYQDVTQDVYVLSSAGLFPTPWPADRIPAAILRRFYVMGITIAKCLQDCRRIDIPLSKPFLKLLSAYGNVQFCDSGTAFNAVGASVEDRFRHLAHTDAAQDFLKSAFSPCTNIQSDEAALEQTADLTDGMLASLLSQATALGGITHWLTGLLSLSDLTLIYPEKGHFLEQVVVFCWKRQQLLKRVGTVTTESLEALAESVFGCSIDDLYIDMECRSIHRECSGQYAVLEDHYEWENQIPGLDESISPQSSPPGKPAEPVTVHNIEMFLYRTLQYCLDKGIRAQLNSFKAGFERVFPMEWLALFRSTELSQLICGESTVAWTREELLAYIMPCIGYTHASPTYQYFVSVLESLSPAQRRAFLQFTTGCSSLPPGGLRNLRPRLRVVRKEGGPYPSVNTCVHYLKLPEYDSEEELRRHLLSATQETGFFLT